MTPILSQKCFLLLLLVGFDEEQSDGRPDEFPYPDEQGDHDAGGGGELQSFRRHEEAALSPSELQGHEEEHVGEEACEGEDENALEVVGIRCHHQEDELDFKCRHHAAG